MVGDQLEESLEPEGGAPPYSWSVTGGSLPPGVSLGHPAEFFGMNMQPGYTYLVGRPMAAGSYSFTLRLSDSASHSVSRDFTWNIQQPITLSYTGLPVNGVPLVVGTAYTQGLLGLGGTGSYTFSTTSTTNPMPPGLTLGASGVVSGTPLS